MILKFPFYGIIYGLWLELIFGKGWYTVVKNMPTF